MSTTALPEISTEEQLQSWVIDEAHRHGWLVAHFRKARTAHGWVTPVQADGKGWPDLVIVRPPRIIFAELKAQRGRKSPEQKRWLSALALCQTKENTVEVYTWYPRERAEIEEVLR